LRGRPALLKTSDGAATAEREGEGVEDNEDDTVAVADGVLVVVATRVSLGLGEPVGLEAGGVQLAVDDAVKVAVIVPVSEEVRDAEVD
jgi:hypothetical protein